MRIRQYFGLLFLLFFSFSAFAADLFHLNTTPLPVDTAYQLSLHRTPSALILDWEIAEGYYLYQDRISLQLNHHVLTDWVKPPAILHQDSLLGSFPVYAHHLTLTLPLSKTLQQAALTLAVDYQGCASDHFCYPPTEKVFQFNGLAPTATNHLTTILSTHSLWALLSFFGLGLLLAFTPCILPMIPILSSLIVGKQQLSTWQTGKIALSYVFGMGLCYAMIGILAGLAGANLQVMLQTPWAIAFISGIFILMALSLFDLFSLQLPAGLQQKIAMLSNQQQAGSLGGSFIMGILATLIVSPCVSPALIAAITYITQTGHVLLGGLALFCMALGMGVPLILFALFGSKILPHAGHWMTQIKYFLGLIMLALAVYLLNRILPFAITLMLAALLLIIFAVLLGLWTPAKTKGQYIAKSLGLFAVLLAGALLFHSVNLFLPTARAEQSSDCTEQPLKMTRSGFTVVTTPAALNTLLSEAQQNHQPVLLDFSADWCIACKEMALFTLEKPAVQQALQPFARIQVDMTKATPAIKTLTTKYEVIAPPTLIFLNTEGEEIPDTRIVGSESAETFLAKLQRVRARES